MRSAPISGMDTRTMDASLGRNPWSIRSDPSVPVLEPVVQYVACFLPVCCHTPSRNIRKSDLARSRSERLCSPFRSQDADGSAIALGQAVNPHAFDPHHHHWCRLNDNSVFFVVNNFVSACRWRRGFPLE